MGRARLWAASAFRSFGPRRLPSQLRDAKQRQRLRPCLRAGARACRHPLGRSRRLGSRKRKGSAARPGRRRRGAERRAAERPAVSVGRRAVPHLSWSIPPGDRGPELTGVVGEIRRVLPGTLASLHPRGPGCRCDRALHSFGGRWCGAAEDPLEPTARLASIDLLPPSSPLAAPVVLRKWLSAWQHFALVTVPCNRLLDLTCAGRLKFVVFPELYLGHILRYLMSQWKMFVSPGLRRPDRLLLENTAI